MVVIRRELPRTNIAGPARGLSHNRHEDSPVRVPLDRPLICPALIAFARCLPAESLRHSPPLVRLFGQTALNGRTDCCSGPVPTEKSIRVESDTEMRALA